ncbi:hypothetical protein [Lacrimispora sp.]|uniref:hypothetical protein n=1 Tax=Lacrimispora sp. TaxID=2719234 RepID=UPI0028969B4C|nr:hypothetical protein [Lacrimispora sp.]
MRRLTIFMTVAALTAVALSGCSTSNQKAPEPAATTAPAAETYAEKAAQQTLLRQPVQRSMG